MSTAVLVKRSREAFSSSSETETQLVLRESTRPLPVNPVNILLRAGACQQDLDKKRQELSVRLSHMQNVKKALQAMIEALLEHRQVSCSCMKTLFQGNVLRNVERLTESQRSQKELLMRLETAMGFEPIVDIIERQCRSEVFASERHYRLDKGNESYMRVTSFKHEFWGTAVDELVCFDFKVTQKIRLASLLSDPVHWRSTLVEARAKLLKADAAQEQGHASVRLMFELVSPKPFHIDSFGYDGDSGGHDNSHLLSWSCDTNIEAEPSRSSYYLLTIRVPLLTKQPLPISASLYVNIH